MAEAVKEAVLAACADVDPLLSPDSKGRARFFGDLSGYTLERREEFKRRLLAVTGEDLKRVAGRYLGGEAAVAVISNEALVRAANDEMGGVFEVAAA
jgi:Zn-dependent M16 (insulinase) family peptidase